MLQFYLRKKSAVLFLLAGDTSKAALSVSEKQLLV